MSDETAISVHFGKPMPLFPLDSAVLLPQQVLPLHIFEPRYRQMIEHCLDGAGQIAMATFAGQAWKQEYHGRPPLRPAVCIGQIAQHERAPEGRYHILLQGVCRARILREVPPVQGRLYRMAILEPAETDPDAAASLGEARATITELLSHDPLSRMAAAEPILEWLNNEDIPSSALLELVSFTIINEPKVRYRLLAEGHAAARAELIIGELKHISRLATRAAAQHPEQWPKGCSWN